MAERPTTPQPQLTLPAECTIATAPALRDQLRDALDAGQPLAVNAGAVARCDTAGMQLLLAARQTAAAAGIPCDFIDVSDQVHEVARLLGVSALLGLPEVARA